MRRRIAARTAPVAPHGRRRPARRRILAAGAVAVPALAWLVGCGDRRPEGVDDPGECVSAADVESERDASEDEGSEEQGTGGSSGDHTLDEDPQLSKLGLALSPDGTRIAANETRDREILRLTDTSGTIIWDTGTGEIVERFDNKLAGAIAWHPGGDLLAIGGQTRIDITDPAGTLLWQLRGHLDVSQEDGSGPDEPSPAPEIRDLAFSPDGELLASLSSDGTVRLWSVRADDCGAEPVLDVGDLEAGSLAFSPDGATLAVAGPGGPVELWDPATGERREQLTDLDGDPHGVAYAPDGTLVVGTDEPGALHLVAPDGAVTAGTTPPRGSPEHIAVSPGGRIAVVARSSNEVAVWDPATDEREDLPRVPRSVGRLIWSPDESILHGIVPHLGPAAWDGSEWRTLELP